MESVGIKRVPPRAVEAAAVPARALSNADDREPAFRFGRSRTGWLGRALWTLCEWIGMAILAVVGLLILIVVEIIFG